MAASLAPPLVLRAETVAAALAVLVGAWME
jgi:hypothetical protein